MKCYKLFIFAVSIISINVSAVEIGFDDLTFSDDQVHLVSSNYKQDGYEVYTDASPVMNWHVYGEDNNSYAGSAGIFTNGGIGAGGYLYYRETPWSGAEYFDVLSVDITRAYFDNYASFNVTFIGQYYDGRPSVTQSFPVNGASTEFETFYFSEAFKGIRQLFWYSGGNPQAQFDNFNVSLTAGDVNNDGFVNAADLMLVQRHLLGLSLLDARAIKRGDLYPENAADGNITISDMLLLAQLILAN